MKFSTMKQGYNRYEVDNEIRNLQNEIEALQLKLRLYKTKNEELMEQKYRLQENYSELKQTLQVREQANEDLSRLALKEANAVIETAHQNAEFIIQEAFVSARLILMEVSRLGSTTNELKGQIKDTIDKIANLVEDIQDFPTINEEDLK